MCISAGDDKIMCRIDPAIHDQAIKRKGCETVKWKDVNMVGYVYEWGKHKTKRILTIGSGLRFDFNKLAKSHPKKIRHEEHTPENQ